MKIAKLIQAGLLVSVAIAGGSAIAQVLPTRTLPQQGGQAIYRGVCQDCHMPDAKGAVGAGMYPSLAGNEKLQEAGYPIAVILHGQKAMPPFGTALDDQQIADVVNFVRSQFGNHYKDKVTAADVKASR